MIYKYELHCHDKLLSACAHSLPEEVVRAYAKAGYAGLVFTNHFLGGNTTVPKDLGWDEKIDLYYSAYLRGLKAAPKGFTVMFGIEHRYGAKGKEVLTYGITPEFLKEYPDLHLFPIEEYAGLVHARGGFISQAHPFRNGNGVEPQFELLDAIETHNFFNTDEENAQATDFAEEQGIYCCSGGDLHDAVAEALGLAGMAFPYPIHASEELVAALKKQDGKMIIAGKVEEK